ncbi:MAG: VCBS repeat-containing protein, partial [Bacteroidetes bacterium]|nr:VCBS repeat-containing protein [Bacteroidota bacterium]
PGKDSGITFSNFLEDSDSLNILEYLYFFNGGGVSLGDINNDGLTDIYFVANQQSNKLYLNQGGFKFKDITEEAGVAGEGDWSLGVTMADVNADGYLDIYVCQLGDYKGVDGKNQLFINNGDNTFSDRASDYGLDFQGFSTQASFFDYDNDGDLDMYLLNHAVHTDRSYGHSTLRNETDPKAGDRMYRNDFDGEEPFFLDVTQDAGIYSSHIGYGLGIATGDINSDGCLDIFICNDFHEDDYLYINNCDGTFKEQLRSSMGHSSRASMGVDISDINNDGLLDIVTLDMLPADEEILKKSGGEDSDEISDIKLRFGYYHQLARNTLQLNRGNGLFSDIALLADIYATDWSWAPLIADFDNNGLKDLFITNGIVKRPNDLDFVHYFSNSAAQLDSTTPPGSRNLALVDLMPSFKLTNYLFSNQTNFQFKDVSLEWGLDQVSFSTGAAYGDLDNDGDLDLVVNNINQEAFVYENKTEEFFHRNYLGVSLQGDGKNKRGIGAKVILEVGNNKILQEQIPTRGFQSAVDQKLIFGLDTTSVVDKLTIIWGDGRFQVLRHLPANQTVLLQQDEASGSYRYGTLQGNSLFEDLEEGTGLSFHHRENEFKDYSREYLIPHKLSTQGPKLAIGDINDDGREDIYICGAKNQAPGLFFQTSAGTFVESRQGSLQIDNVNEDTDAAFFDFDGDKDLDLYVTSGGNELTGRNFFLRDRLYVNDGVGRFSIVSGALPDIFANASCVSPADYDNDGDVDLFVGTRNIPGQYGISPPSYLLNNDGSGRFRVYNEVDAPGLFGLGMVTEGIWSDFDQDGDLDLIVVGEWMPITVFENQDGKLKNVTGALGLELTNGWWNTVLSVDIDNDGDPDYLAGNMGLNSKIKASQKEPATLFVHDFDTNGTLDPIICYYKDGYSTPFPTRDQLV